MDRLWDDKMEFHIFAAAILVMLAFHEWWCWFFKVPRLPWITTTSAVAYIAFATLRLRPLYRQHRQLRLGRDGERIVGQELEKLREHGYRVYHDFLGDKSNIDHIVIGPTGVFTINTKAVSKPKSVFQKSKSFVSGWCDFTSGLSPNLFQDRDAKCIPVSQQSH